MDGDGSDCKKPWTWAVGWLHWHLADFGFIDHREYWWDCQLVLDSTPQFSCWIVKNESQVTVSDMGHQSQQATVTAGWWFGTWLLFFHMLGRIIPTDFHFFRGLKPPTRQSLYPIGSMYAIYGNIYHQYTPNVSIYTIHGSYGYGCVPRCTKINIETIVCCKVMPPSEKSWFLKPMN